MTTWYSAPAPRRRLPVWAKVLIGLAVAAVLGTALFFAAIVVAFSGGLDDVLDVSNPERDDRSVVRAREAATPRAQQLHDALLSATPSALAADTAVRASFDDCLQGQHDWKVDTDYDLACTVGRVAVLEGDGPAVAQTLDAALDGWTREAPIGQGLESFRWVRGDDPDRLQEVVVRTIRPGGRGVSSYELGPFGTEVTRAGAPLDPETLSGGPYVVVSVSERYFYA